MNVNFKNSNYKTGEPIELIIDIQGIGNIKVIHPPILKNTQNIKIYENQKVIISIQKNENFANKDYSIEREQNLPKI